MIGLLTDEAVTVCVCVHVVCVGRRRCGQTNPSETSSDSSAALLTNTCTLKIYCEFVTTEKSQLG